MEHMEKDRNPYLTALPLEHPAYDLVPDDPPHVPLAMWWMKAAEVLWEWDRKMLPFMTPRAKGPEGICHWT